MKYSSKTDLWVEVFDGVVQEFDQDIFASRTGARPACHLICGLHDLKRPKSTIG